MQARTFEIAMAIPHSLMLRKESFVWPVIQYLYSPPLKTSSHSICKSDVKACFRLDYCWFSRAKYWNDLFVALIHSFPVIFVLYRMLSGPTGASGVTKKHHKKYHDREKRIFWANNCLVSQFPRNQELFTVLFPLTMHHCHSIYISSTVSTQVYSLGMLSNE